METTSVFEDAELLISANPSTGEWLPIVGVSIAGGLLVLCIIFAVISSIRKKNGKGGKKK